MFNQILKKISLFCLLAFLVSCKQEIDTVVVAGDSWASFICAFKSFDEAFKNYGLEASVNSTCLTTTKAGARASVWLDSVFHQATKTALANPSAKVLFYSMGGNDVIADWNKNMNAAEEAAVIEKIATKVQEIVQVYQTLRPDIKILISGYDYPRFTSDHPIEAYRKMYSDMGQPSPYELNSFLNRFSKRMSLIANQKNIFYIQHNGMMQYYLGNSEANLLAFKTLSPDQISAKENSARFGGEVSVQSNKTAMLTLSGPGVTLYDAFHLSHWGYGKLAEHSVGIYMKDWLKWKEKQ